MRINYAVRDKQVCADYQAGMLWADIQKKYHFGSVNLSRILRRYNIKLRSGKTR